MKHLLALFFGLLTYASAAFGQALTITTNSTLPPAYLGEALSPIPLEATGGPAPYTWSLVTGSQALVGKLATGLSVNPSGQIVGTPTALQAPVGFTVQVADSSSPKKITKKVFTIAVVSTTPKLVVTPIRPAFLASNYAWTFNATEGKAPYTWSTNSTLPQGLSLNATTGILGGMVSSSQPLGNYTLAITVSGSNGKSVSGNFILSVLPAFAWVTDSVLPGGKAGTAYSQNLTVSGGKSPYTFATKNGSTLPAGLTLNATTRRISGTPTASGNFSFTITARDSASPANTLDRTFTLAIESYGMSVNGTSAISGQRYKLITPAPFTVSGGVAPYTWSTTPALPAALTINATTGMISGNLTAAPGNYTVAVTVKDKGNQTASRNSTITVQEADPFAWVTPETLPGGKVATAYSQNLTVSGGKSPYTFATKNGSTLPAGLTLNATTRRISGTPTASGNFSFTITARDSASPANSIERTFTLAIESYGMSVNGTSAISGKQYTAITPAPFTVSGGVAPYTWSTTPALPAALTINATTGMISGNLTAAPGNYTVAVTVKDKGNQTASRNSTITVQEADPFAWVTPETLPGGKVATAYSQNLTVSGGKSPYTFATKNGSTLPAGLTLNATTRRISGTPTASGNFSFTITARDSASPANTLDRPFTLAIESYGMSVNGTSAISGKQYTAITPAPFTVTGGVGPYSWSTTPALPAALTINATTGMISGNLTAAPGNYTVAVTVKDKGNQTASRNSTITVQEADPFAWVTPETLPGGKVATAYSQNLTVSGGKSPYTFATKNGSTLSAGLTLNATTRRISGTPTASGNFSFTITARDSASPANSIERTFTLAIESYGMSVNGTSAISGKQYTAITSAPFTVTGGVGPYSWSTTPALPAALTINATTGMISGNLTAAPGNYTVAVTVKDKGNQTASRNCTITVQVADPFAWVTPETLPSGKVATAYSQNLTVSGGKSPYTFATKNGSAPPAWLTLNATTGRLSGTPTAAGNYTFTVMAKDTASPVNGIERTFTLAVQAYGMVITDNSPSEISGIQFQPLTPTPFAVLGGVPVYKWSSTPTPPAGLTLNSTTGILSGVPSVAGNTTIAVRVTDGANQTVTKNCTIRILPAGNLTITTASPLPSATVNTSYSTTLAASGGKPFLTANQSTFYNWTIANRGNLPTNFTLNATTGILSGTANAVLTANFTVRVTDAANVFATKNCSLQITAPLDTGDADGDGVNNYREAYDGTDPFDNKSFNPLSIGLVAHYPFDGNAKDESGFGRNATVTGATLGTDRFSANSRAYAFNGTNSLISCQFSNLSIQEKTFSAWVYIDPVNQGGGGVAGLQSVGGAFFDSLVYNETSQGWGFGSNYLTRSVWSGVKETALRWVHMVAAYTNNQYRLYQNGSLILTTTNFPANIFSNPEAIIGMRHTGGTAAFLRGSIDEVRFYNRALTAAEVSQLYSKESGEPNMVLVQGGTLPVGSALANQTIAAFHIARFETTWAEWKQVRTWAAANGYDIGTAGQGSADNHPVRNVSWHDTVKWLNAKSQMEGFVPVYSVNGTTYKSGQSIPTLLSTANGYRLPAEAEWEWAARGGVSSQGYTYSGSNDINAVAWFSGNSDNGTKAVGTKASNELGLYDMSGNVFEFCFEAYPDGTNQNRQLKGGAWNWDAAVPAVAHRVQWAGIEWRTNNIGFRYARNAIGDMVTVQGGTLPAGSALANQTVQAFQIGRTEVTWGEWKTVRTWAVANGYTDLANVGEGSADNHPVRNVNWYDVVKWSNAKSQMEGLVPVYSVNGTTYKSGQNIPILNTSANGYRLLFDAEWEWAARGGILSAGLTYSGSNELNSVAWYRGNSNGAFVDLGTNYGGSGYSGRGTWPVGLKVANELGVFDMSGNVLEWCFDDTSGQRAIRGSDWATDSTDCRLGILRGPTEPTWSGKNAGFRLARNIGPKISISGTLPEATLNQSYAGYTFGVVGSTGDKVWSISEGALPPGMSFSANGTLSGTPTTAGPYTFVIRLESGGYWDEVEVELEVVASGLSDADNDGVNHYREAYDGTDPFDPTSFNPLSVGLVAHYPFERSAKDESGFSQKSTIYHTEFTSDGSAKLNGSSSYVTSSYPRPINNAFTWSIWLKAIEIKEMALIESANFGINGLSPSLILEPSGTVRFSSYDDNLSGEQNGINVIKSKGIITSNSWHHILVTSDSANQRKIYIDGILDSTKGSSGYGQFFSNLIFGADRFKSIWWYGGELDDVRIYNRALTAAEVSQLYKKETAKPIINYQNSLYTIVHGPSWSQAEANALKLGGHLVSINTSQENDFLWQEFSNATKYQIRPNAPESPGIFSHWIGLTDVEGEGNWKWSNGDAMQFVNPPFTIQEGTYRTDENWVRVTWNIPSSWTGGIETKGFWQDHNVNAYQIGYETPTGIAEIPFVRFRDSAYVVVQGPTWEEAEANAIKLGGHLVTINDVEEWNWFKAQFSPQNGYAYQESYSHYPQGEVQMWVGLNDAESEGVYEWVSGEASTVDFSDLVRSGGDDYGVWQWEQGKLTFYTNAAPSEWLGFAKNLRGVAEIKLPPDSFDFDELVTVEGGTLSTSNGLNGTAVESFEIGKYEVTWAKWLELRDWAVNNGYTDLAGVGQGSRDDHPVRNVSWHDVVKWCNARSEKEGLAPVYQIGGSVYRVGVNIPTINSSANGYRLPSDKEWEWAARGGVSSQGYTYSGSNDVNAVAWYSVNAGGGTKAVGTKTPNELGIYDMSGNVWEWCEDLVSGSFRLIRSGSSLDPAERAAVSFRAWFGNPGNRDNNIGFRLVRNAPSYTGLVTTHAGTGVFGGTNQSGWALISRP
jgi:formylglycine-generating enzyme required for sulfatase activity